MSRIARVLSMVLLAACACGNPAGFADVTPASPIFSRPSLDPFGGWDCEPVGVVTVPARSVGFIDKYFGFAEDEFHQSVTTQTKRLGAILVVMSEEADLEAIASSGEPFQASAYRCR